VAAGGAAPAARGGRTWASALPILSTRSIAVTGISVGSGASAVGLGAELRATGS
jgi:hypothetical protein